MHIVTIKKVHPFNNKTRAIPVDVVTKESANYTIQIARVAVRDLIQMLANPAPEKDSK